MTWLSKMSVAIGLMLARVRRRASGKWQDRTTRLLVVVLAVLAVPGLAVALLAAVRGDDWWGFWLNLGTELIGAVLVYILLQLFLGRESRKRELIEKMGSTVHDVAIEAVEELRHRGWLSDGSLRGAHLVAAHLEGANLIFAHLERALLMDAHLEGAHLVAAHLERAFLMAANLERAHLGAAHLEGAFLQDAHLEGVRLGGASFDETTTLPDGTRWVPDTDLARFTDPDHPDFWRYLR